jgi:hypothetical protein
MCLGRWLSTHPPIAHRLAALDPALAPERAARPRVALAAAAVAVAGLLVPLAIVAGLWSFVRRVEAQALATRTAAAQPSARASEDVESGMLSLADAAEAHRSTDGAPPADVQVLYRRWAEQHPGEAAPIDPYDGRWFGYRVDGDEYVIWSAGPDPRDPADDISYSSADKEKGGEGEDSQEVDVVEGSSDDDV